MPKSRFGPAAFAFVLSAFTLAGSAIAGRTIQVDIAHPVPICALGSSDCQGVDVSGVLPFSTAYVYAQGIVSFDSRLPEGANIGDVGSLGGGSWFTPGFSETANYQASLAISYVPDFDSPPTYLLSFYEPGVPVYGDPDDPENPIPPAFPLFQIQLFSSLDYYAETGVGFNYRVDPTPGALIGFNHMGVTQAVSNSDGLLVGPDGADSDFVTYFNRLIPGEQTPVYDDDGNVIYYQGGEDTYTKPSLFEPRYAEIEPPLPSETPEPAEWAMLILGFGCVGGALRRHGGGRQPAAA